MENYKIKVNNAAESNPKTEQGLISGADALRALADGQEVQHFNKKMATLGNLVMDEEWGCCDELTISDFNSGLWAFRLKPHTIKLELEIPTPFEPKEGEKAYRLAPAIPSGYTEFYFEEDEYEHQFGAWRTEEQIKQVVAALRGALKNG